ncbi:tripartite tricarboxylate transporter substrate binding protein [Roseiarcaceae bacterium H3SJ34-1]|uniref:Bug family tripartite tricarboxylate transporter substrate binding protein n=1 Tax=Terripilifer ovatus TaxID=3032367 RepID=UPI003AB97C62|nr:tripartite tricarboxylate transporter substrate binding protein [Roseiarcaceae bacterium H3SJ34-1]
MISRRDFTLSLGCATLASPLMQARAQAAYPNKPVKIVIPWPVGGAVDNHSRALSVDLQKKWNQTVIIEARPGGNGIIGAEYSARSAPDGYTIYNGNDSSICMLPFLYKTLSYDPIKDFEPVVCMMAGVSTALVAASLPIKSFKELIDYAKANPGKINYGSFGIGSKTHVDTEALSLLTGIKMTHIPYKGIADVNAAMAAGELHFALGIASAVMPNIQKGLIRPIFVAGEQRTPVLPDVPTIKEAGGPDFVSRSWFGLFFPAKTPAAIVDKVANDVAEISESAAFKERYVLGFGLDPLVLKPAAFRELIQKDTAFYRDALAKLNLKLE